MTLIRHDMIFDLRRMFLVLSCSSLSVVLVLLHLASHGSRMRIGGASLLHELYVIGVCS
jgi:hypothetical protein